MKRAANAHWVAFSQAVVGQKDAQLFYCEGLERLVGGWSE